MSVNITRQGIVFATGENINPNLFKTTPKSANTTTYNAYQINMTENLTAGTTYTIQFWNVNVSHTGKTEAQLGVYFYWGGGMIPLGSWSGTTSFTNGHADYLVKTFTPSSSQASGSGATNAWLNIYNSVPNASGTMDMSIERWKLEKGAIATPWIPSPLDSTYIGDTCGFTELDRNIVSIGNGYIAASEFIEW